MIVSSASLLVRIVEAKSRCSSSSSLRSSSPLIPITAFIGVRISWLIAARNVLFAAFAASAAARASCATAYSRALSSAIDASCAKRWSRSTSGGVEGAIVRMAASDAQRPDRVLPRDQGDRHERSDLTVRDGLRAASPPVVVVDDERLAGRPDAAGEPFPGRHPAAHVLLEHADRDAPLDLLLARPADVDVAVARVEQLAGPLEQLLQEVGELEPVHHAERRLVQRTELGVLDPQLLGPLRHALLETLERLAQS